MRKPAVINQLDAVAARILAHRGRLDIVDVLEGRAKDADGNTIPALQLVDKDSDYRGPFSTDNCPDLREILRSCVSPDVETTVVVGPTQSFKTTLLKGVAAYTVAFDPGALGWVMPTEPLARAFSTKRLQPDAAATPWLAALIPDNSDDYTNLSLGFKTCTLRLAGSNSPTNLASFSYKRVIGDEVDKYPQRIRNEAGTLDLLLQRTGQYTHHNHIFVSTPTVPWGTIWQAALRGDCRRYHVPCPHCSKLFVQAFAYLRWDENAKHANGTWDFARVERTAHLQCPHCQGEIWEHHRRDILHAGQWIPDPVDLADQRRADYELIADPKARSYFRSCFNVIHPNRTFAVIARKHLLAGKDPSKRQNFTNGELGEIHEEAGETLAAEVLFNRREDYLAEPADPTAPLLLPDGVLVLTAAVDVQASPARIECDIVGWGEGMESWGIQYLVIEKRTTWRAAFDELDRHLLRPWHHPLGFELIPAAICVDTGHETEEVYAYVRRCQPRRVYAVKGSSEGYGQPLVSRPQKSGVRKVTLYMIGTVTAKEELMSRMRLTEEGPGMMHFPKEPRRGYDLEYFRQLTAESAVVRYSAGRKVIKFIKPAGRRNEALDIRCYNRAALQLLDPDFHKINAKLAAQGAQLEMPLATPPPPAEAPAAEPAPPPHDLPAPATAEIDLADGKITPVTPSAPAEPPAAEPTPKPAPNTYTIVTGDRPAADPRPVQKLIRPRRKSWATRW